jgi:hypothetical protein
MRLTSGRGGSYAIPVKPVAAKPGEGDPEQREGAKTQLGRTFL